jgi:hypothetical protein
MALTTPDRAAVAARYMSDKQCPGGVIKADLTAAIVAADDWLDTNLSGLNSAIPVTFRTAATTAENYMLLMFILMKRMGKL